MRAFFVPEAFIWQTWFLQFRAFLEPFWHSVGLWWHQEQPKGHSRVQIRIVISLDFRTRFWRFSLYFGFKWVYILSKFALLSLFLTILLVFNWVICSWKAMIWCERCCKHGLWQRSDIFMVCCALWYPWWHCLWLLVPCFSKSALRDTWLEGAVHRVR